MSLMDYSYYWTEPDYALLHGGNGSFIIVDDEGVHIIEDDELCHEIILNMLKKGQKIYDTVQDFQKKKAVAESRYHEYQEAYFQWWKKHSSQMIVEIEKRSDVFKCAGLIKRFAPSFKLGDIKKHLIQGRFFFTVEDCDGLMKKKELQRLINALLDEGADVELYKLGKRLELEEYFLQEQEIPSARMKTAND